MKSCKGRYLKSHESNHGKSFVMAVTLLLILAIFVSGTYALQMSSENSERINTPPAGGRLHDDYEVIGNNFGENRWQQGLTANKNIYVENFENTTGQNIFVRIKLYEYMEIGKNARLQPGDEGFNERLAMSIVPESNREDLASWSPFIPELESTNPFRIYWSWNMGGEKTYMPTFNRDPMSLEADVKGDGICANALQPNEIVNTTHRGEKHEYPKEAGLKDFFESNVTHTAQMKYWDLSGHVATSYTVSHTARKTLDAQIVQMEDWDKTPANVWVIDGDGWIYWAAPLEPETATGLLLDSIILIENPSEEWFYSIYTEAQLATADDWKIMFYLEEDKVPSPKGEELMNIITAKPDENPAKDVPAGGTFKDSKGNIWRVLAIDGNGNKLIITEHVYGLGTMYHSEDMYVRLQNSDGLRPALNTWYDNQIGADLRTRALTAVNVENDVRLNVHPGPFGDWYMENEAIGWTSAGDKATKAEQAIFVLSISEVNRYGSIGTLNSLATVPGGTRASLWWLRSPGPGSVGPISCIRDNGSVSSMRGSASAQLSNNGFRPTMWITLEEF